MADHVSEPLSEARVSDPVTSAAHSLPGGGDPQTSDEVSKLAQDDIWHAARRGDAAAIEQFVHSSVSVNAVDECGRTAAYYAGLYGHTALAGLLRDFEIREAAAKEQGQHGEPSRRPFQDEGDRLAAARQRGLGAPILPGPLPRKPQPTRHLMSREAAAAEGIVGAMEATVIDTQPATDAPLTARANKHTPRKYRKRPMSPASTRSRSRSARSSALAGAGSKVVGQGGKGGQQPTKAQRQRALVAERRRKTDDMRSARERLRKRRLNEMVRRQRLEDLEAHKDTWMARRGLKTGFEFTREQKRELKRWFNFLDADGSGEINIEELEDPLLSTGIARNQAELKKLLQAVDTDGSGEIGFDEFLAVLKPRGAAAGAAAASANNARGGGGGGGDGGGGGAAPGNDSALAFAALQKQLNDDNNPLPLQLLVTMHRRKFLLETIVGDPEQSERERRELRRAEEHAAATNNVYMLSQVKRRQRQREAAKQQRMERLSALQAVVDRNKRRETMNLAEQAAGDDGDGDGDGDGDVPGDGSGMGDGASTSGPLSTARGSSVGAPTPRAGNKGAVLELDPDEAEELSVLRASYEARKPPPPQGLLRPGTGDSGGRSTLASPNPPAPTRQPRSAAAKKESKLARNRARMLNSGSGMQFAPRSLEGGSKARGSGAGDQRGKARAQGGRGRAGGAMDASYGMPLHEYDG